MVSLRDTSCTSGHAIKEALVLGSLRAELSEMILLTVRTLLQLFVNCSFDCRCFAQPAFNVNGLHYKMSCCVSLGPPLAALCSAAQAEACQITGALVFPSTCYFP